MNFHANPINMKNKSQQYKWIAIFLFIGTPWLLGIVLWAIRPPSLPSEAIEKSRLIDQRGSVDTVVVGDSRMRNLVEASFAKRGWRYFNMALSGLSPEDTALQILYAVKHHPIKRVIIGVSFENMTETFPFEHSIYYLDEPFQNLEIFKFLGVTPQQINSKQPKFFGVTPQQINSKQPKYEQLIRRFIPIGQAQDTFQYYYKLHYLNDTTAGRTLADGSAPYEKILNDIKKGKYNFKINRDPKLYFYRDDSVARYLKTKTLSGNAKDVYLRIFDYLRSKNIVCLVVETHRTAAYQAMIDKDPLLVQLQNDWRSFYLANSNGSIRFIDDIKLADLYDENDFFDCCHYIGKTVILVAERLAKELGTLEATYSGTNKEKVIKIND